MDVAAKHVTVTFETRGSYPMLTYSLDDFMDCRIIRVPREATEDGKVMRTIAVPGVYIYANRTPSRGMPAPCIYIGQSNDANRRLHEHGRKDDWNWNELFMFEMDHGSEGIQKGVEQGLIAMFQEDRFWDVINKLDNPPDLGERENHAKERYLGIARRLLYVAGIGSFQTKRRSPPVQLDILKIPDTAPALKPVATVTFHLGDPEHPLATAESDGRGITVKAGSMAMTPGKMSEAHLRLRKGLVRDKVISAAAS